MARGEMVYAIGAAVVAGQLGAGCWPAAPLAASLVVALGLGGAAAVARRGRGMLARIACVALACAVGAGGRRAVDAPPSGHGNVAALDLPWRGEFVGVVHGEPVRRRGSLTVLVAMERVGSGRNQRAVRGLVRLAGRRLYGWHDGDRVRGWATLRHPRGFRSPGAFDFRGYLARRGVHVVGTMWDAPRAQRVGRLARPAFRVARWRRAAGRALADATDGRVQAVLAALILGDRAGLSPRLRERFARAGVLHVLVVSGLHLALVGALAARTLETLAFRSEWLALHCDVARMAAVASLVPVGAYVALVGPSTPVARALTAACLAAAAAVAGRRLDPWRAWMVAMAGVSIVWPGVAEEAGCQLSFASVAGVLLASSPRPPTLGGRVALAVRMAATVTVVTAPVAARHFDTLTPMAIVANPVVVPLFGGAVLGPGLMAAVAAPWCHGVATALFAAAGWLVRPGIALVDVLGGSGAFALAVPRPTGVEVALCYGAIAAWQLRATSLGRRLVAAALVAGALDAGWWTMQRWMPGRLRIAFLDVGQGDATVVEWPDGRVMAIDAGGFPGSTLDPGRAVVEPYLRTRKISRLDTLIMSHAHPDHAGGLPRLVERFRPREFWWAGIGGEGAAWRALDGALRRGKVQVRSLGRLDEPGRRGEVAVLHPPRRWSAASLNEASLVLSLRAAGVVVLLTGDVEQRAEQAMLSSAAAGALGSDILKVPHHGSRTSSAEPWLAAVHPALAVVSVGADNRYGLPVEDVLARYRARGACVLRTDRCGTIVVEVRGGAWRVTAVDPGCRCPSPR